MARAQTCRPPLGGYVGVYASHTVGRPRWLATVCSSTPSSSKPCVLYACQSEPSTLNPQPLRLYPCQSKPSIIHTQPATLNPQPSTLNPQPSTLSPQPSAHNHCVCIHVRAERAGQMRNTRRAHAYPTALHSLDIRANAKCRVARQP
jgi:hypothetical protein